MVDYIVCPKKRNSPRLNIRICEAKCKERHQCEAYLEQARPSKNREGFLVTPASSPPLTAHP